MTHSYTDRHGKVIEIKHITNATMRRAKLSEFAWFADPTQIGRIMQDPTALAEALHLTTDLPLDVIDDGLDGDCIEEAEQALMEAIILFSRSRIRPLIRQEVQKAYEELDRSINAAIEQQSKPKESSDGQTSIDTALGN